MMYFQNRLSKLCYAQSKQTKIEESSLLIVWHAKTQAKKRALDFVMATGFEWKLDCTQLPTDRPLLQRCKECILSLNGNL